MFKSRFIANFTVVSLIFCASSLANATPMECFIDFYRAPRSGGDLIAVVGGSARSEGSNPIFITVRNGRGTYTTMASQDGRWTVPFKLMANQLSAEVWGNTSEPIECQESRYMERATQ